MYINKYFRLDMDNPKLSIDKNTIRNEQPKVMYNPESVKLNKLPKNYQYERHAQNIWYNNARNDYEVNPTQKKLNQPFDEYKLHGNKRFLPSSFLDKENAFECNNKTQIFKDVKLNKITLKNPITEAYQQNYKLDTSAVKLNNQKNNIYALPSLGSSRFIDNYGAYHPKDLNLKPNIQSEPQETQKLKLERANLNINKNSNLVNVGLSTIPENNNNFKAESANTDNINFKTKHQSVFDKSTDQGLIDKMIQKTKNQHTIILLKKRLRHKENYTDRKGKLSKLMYLN